jgi:hypothetical protein
LRALEDDAIAPDGLAMAYTTAKETVFCDAEGTVLARLPEAARVEFSSARVAAALVGGKLVELDLETPKPAQTPLAAPADVRGMVIDLRYIGRELVVMTGQIELWGWDGKTTYRRGSLTNVNGSINVANNGYMVLSSSDNKVHFMSRAARGSVQLPANLIHPRVVAHRTSSRVLVVADGIILGFDLDALRPQVLDIRSDTLAEFVGDDTLIAGHTFEQIWEWIDLESGKHTKIDFEPRGPVMFLDLDAGGRVLLHEMGPKGTRVHLLVRGKPETKLIAEGQGAWGVLIPGNAIAYAAGDPRIMAIVDDKPPREIAKVAGIANGAAPIGHHKVAVHSSDGELIRIDVATGAIAPTTIAVGSSFLMAGDPATGRVVVAEDARVMLWDSVVTQIASFDKPVTSLEMVQGAAAVGLRDNETFLVDLRPNQQPVRVFPPGRLAAKPSADGRLYVSVNNAEQITVLELPQRTRWTVPPYFSWYIGGTGLHVSPSKRRVVQHAARSLVLWTLPLAPAQDLAQWLEEQTNATVDTDGELLWPWQTPNPK